MTTSNPSDDAKPVSTRSGRLTEGSIGASPAAGGTPLVVPDFEKLANNAALFIQQSGKALSAYLKPYERGEPVQSGAAEKLTVALTAIGKVAEHWMSDPARMVEAQSAISAPFLQLWAQTYRRMQGEKVEPLVPIAKGDKRYASPHWGELPFYDFLRQAHALSATWAQDLADRSTELDPKTRAKAKFYLKQVASALSPANFLATNPEIMVQTFATAGENLARGVALLAEDIESGNGSLRIRQTDHSQFELGRNIATTPGKVIYRNALAELIQYEPTTPDVLKRPLVIIPPWINKYYILDLNAEKSFVRWAVDQGITVFVVSWVNPDERHRDKTFESYMREGIFDVLSAVQEATGEESVNAIGYCVGGTLLSAALAYMADKNDQRIATATFFTAQSDFTDAGDIQVFIDDEQVETLEEQMAEKGYLDGSKMAMAFNMLRPNDLVWSYVVNNYMKGTKPAAFDLLYWNSDSTRLPAKNHSFYLRNFYIANKMAKGEMTLGGVKLDLGKVKLPIYSLAAREDHIAPAASVFRGAKLFGSPVRYVLSGSGHIAGVINPPAKGKYNYLTGASPSGSLEEWIPAATVHDGSWWPDWFAWLEAQNPDKVPARQPGSGRLPALADAPGDYVMSKS